MVFILISIDIIFLSNFVIIRKIDFILRFFANHPIVRLAQIDFFFVDLQVQTLICTFILLYRSFKSFLTGFFADALYFSFRLLPILRLFFRLDFRRYSALFYSCFTAYKSRKILVLSVEISAFNSNFIEKSAIFSAIFSQNSRFRACAKPPNMRVRT